MAFSSFNSFQSNLWKSFGGGLAYLLNYRFSTTDSSGISIYNYADVSAGTALTPKYDASMSITGLIVTYRTVATNGSLNIYNGGYVTIANIPNPGSGGLTISTWFRSQNSSSGYWPILYFSNGVDTDVISMGVNNGTISTSVYQTETPITSSDYTAYTTPFSSYSLPINIEGLAITSNKSRLLIATYGGTIYISTYSGSSWGSLSNTNITGLSNVAGAAITYDGSRGVVSKTGGLTYFFIWNGTTYASLTSTNDTTRRNYYDIDITSDGSRIITAVNNGYIYFANWNSTNYDSFTQTNDTNSRGYNGCGISSDGTYIAYSTNTGYVYVATWDGTNYSDGVVINSTSIGTASGVKFNSDSSKIFVSLQYNNTNTVIYFSSTSPGVYSDNATSIISTYIPVNINTWAFCLDTSGSIYIDNYAGDIYYSQYLTTTTTPVQNTTISLGIQIPSFASYSQPITNLDNTGIKGFCISVDGTKAIYSSYSGNIYYTSYSSSTWSSPTAIYNRGVSRNSTISMNGDATRAVIAYYITGGVYYFNINGTSPITLVQTGEARVNRNCSSSAMSTDGNTVVYSEELNGHVFYQKWNSGSNNYDPLVIIPTPTINTLHEYTAVGVSSDGNTIAYYNNTNYTFNIGIWSSSITNYNITTSISFTTALRHIRFTYDNNFIYFTKYTGSDSGAGVYYLTYTGSSYDTSFNSVSSSAIPSNLDSGAFTTDGSGNLYYAGITSTSIYKSVVSLTSILGNVNDNLWRHISWQISSNGTYTYYVNGTLLYTSGSGMTYPYTVNRLNNYVGNTLSTGSGINNYYIGGIDELRVYKQILPTTTLSSNFEEGNIILTAPTGLAFNTLYTIGTINFTHSGGYVQRYNYRIVPTSGTTLTGTLSDTSYNISNLVSGTTYTLFLSATNPKGTTSESSLSGINTLQSVFYYKFNSNDPSGVSGISIYDYANVVNGTAGSPIYDSSMSTVGLISASGDYLNLSTSNSNIPQYVDIPSYRNPSLGNISISCWSRTSTTSGTQTMYELGSSGNNYNITLGLSSGLPFASIGGNVTSVTFSGTYTTQWSGLSGNIYDFCIDKYERNAVMVDRTKTYLLDSSYNNSTSTWSSFFANSSGDVSDNITCLSMTEDGTRGVIGTIAGNVYTFTRTTGNLYTGFTKVASGAIIGGNLLYYAAGSGTNSFSYSTTAATSWTAGTGMTTSIFSNSTRCIAAAGNTLAAVGDGSSYTLAYSLNSGTSWTSINKTIFTTYGNSICWSSSLNLFVAGGSGTNGLAYSSNGVTWTGLGTTILSQGIDVKWNGSMFVATGKNSAGTAGGMGYSYNGTTWASGTGSNFTTLGLQLSWNGTYWTAIGTDIGGNTMLYSTDGIAWSIVTGTNINGNTFTSIGSRIGGNIAVGFQNISMSNTLTFLRSTNTISSGTNNYLTCSNDGNIIVSCGSSTGIYRTNNMGTSWSLLSNAGTRNWTGISGSSNLTTIIACVNPGNILVSNDSGSSWISTGRGFNVRWTSVACNSDGTIFAASHQDNDFLYKSTNNGSTWNTMNGSGFRGWNCVKMNNSGNILVGLPFTYGFVVLSTDSGVNWSSQTSLGSNVWMGVALNSSGNIIAAVSNFIYVTTNTGSSWTSRYITASWTGISINSDGTRMAAANTGNIHFSINNGVSWTAITGNPIGGGSSNNNNSIATSSSGKFVFYSNNTIIAIMNYNDIFLNRIATAPTPITSSWTVTDTTLNTSPSSIIHDASNNIFYASDFSGNIISSTTNAASWSSRSQVNSLTSIFSLTVKPHDPVTSVALDARGNSLAVAIQGNYIYTARWNGTTYPTFTKIADSNINPTTVSLSNNGNILAYGASTNIYYSFWNGSTYPASTALAISTGAGSVDKILFTTDTSGSGILLYGVNNSNATATVYSSVFGTTTYGTLAGITASSIPVSRPTSAMAINYSDNSIYHVTSTNIIKAPFFTTNAKTTRTYYTTSLADGKWHHYVWTMSTTGTGVLTYYIDGVQANTYSSGVSMPTSILRTYNTIGMPSKQFINGWNGNIDEFNYLNMLMSSNQVGLLYSNYLPTSVPTLNSISISQYFNSDLSLNFTITETNGIYNRPTSINVRVVDSSNTTVFSNQIINSFINLTIPGLLEFTNYTAYIYLSNNIGNSSNISSNFTTYGYPASPITGLTNTNTLVTKSTVSYNASTRNVTGYYVSFSPSISGSPFTVSTSTLTNNFSGLSPNTSYTVSVYAIGLYGNSAPSTTSMTTYNYPAGGSISTNGNYRIHSFLSTGTSAFTNSLPSLTINYLLVGSGGGGGVTGGGGAGAVLNGSTTITNTSYTIVLGTPSTGGSTQGISGINGTSTTAFGIIAGSGGGGQSSGGGGGGSRNGTNGSSGGGVIKSGGGFYSPGIGSPPGFDGGAQGFSTGSGGGGAGGAGGSNPGTGGIGKIVNLPGYTSAQIGGGGSGGGVSSVGYGGGAGGTSGNKNGSNGAANTGGGGGGTFDNIETPNAIAGSGGSGLVVVTYDISVL